VELVASQDPNAQPVNLKRTIDDPSEIDRLASYFPGMDSDRRSRIYGRWIPWLTVEFVRADGSVISVRSDYRDWTEGEGRGDFPVRGDLGGYVREVLGKSQ
jgi:hypothetical protein